MMVNTILSVLYAFGAVSSLESEIRSENGATFLVVEN